MSYLIDASRADARHIATATVHHVTVLVSWNFRHIVNLERIHVYNSVNLRYGYPMLEIRTPWAEALGRKVDLIPIEDAYPFVRRSMEKELVVLYEAKEELRRCTANPLCLTPSFASHISPHFPSSTTAAGSALPSLPPARP